MKNKRKLQLQQIQRVDFNIWAVVILLCSYGGVMVMSVSSYECSLSEVCNYDPMYYVKRQTVFMLLGIACMFIGQFLNYNLLQKISWLVYISGILCILLLKSPLGVSANGASRWLRLGPVQFQVAEVVKICVIVFIAYLINKHYRKLHTVKVTILLWIAGGVPAALLLKMSNDLGSSIVVLGITFFVSAICTRTEKIHLIVVAAVVICVGIYVLNIANNLPSQSELNNLPFRVGRIAAWINPERYADAQGYQVLQGLYAIASGGVLGKGLGNSMQKFIIPEAQNDMIFSIICEELGIFGAVIAIGLIFCLLYQILRIIISSENLYGSILALGVFLHITIQSFINIAVNCNVLPNTGLPLPFFSAGGSSLFFLLLEIAIVLSVERVRIKAVRRR